MILKYLKNAAIIAIVVPVAVVVLLVVVLYSVDPNSFKPIIKEQLAEKNIDLQFDGDLRWSVYPVLRLQLGALTVSTIGVSEPLAKLRSASLALQVPPLFKRELKFDALIIDGVRLNLIESESGGNWRHIGADKSAQAANNRVSAGENNSPPDSAKASTNLNVHRIRIKDLEATYRNTVTDQIHAIEDLNLQIDNLNASGKPLSLTLSSVLEMDSIARTKLFLEASASLSLDASEAIVPAMNIRIHPDMEGAEIVDISVDASINWSNQTKIVSELTVPAFNAERFLKQMNLGELGLAEAAQSVRLASTVSYDGVTVLIDGFRFHIADFLMTGQTQVNLDTLKVAGEFKGTALNINDLIKVSENDVAAQHSADAEEPLPLEQLRALGLDLRFAFDKIKFDNHIFDQPAMHVKGDKGLFSLTTFTGEIYEGKLSSVGSFDVRSDTAIFALDATLSQLNIGKVTQAFTEKVSLSGAGDTSVNIKTHGNSVVALTNNVNLEATFTLPELLFNGVNITQKFCQSVALFEKGVVTKSDWAESTKFAPIALSANYARDVVSLNSFEARVEHLLTKADGQLNLKSGAFSFPFDLRVNALADHIEGCTDGIQTWKDNFLPLICEGNMAELGVKTCGPDVKRIKKILASQVKKKIDQKKSELQAKLNAEKKRKRVELEQKKRKKKKELEQKAKEKLDKMIDKKTKKKLKDLFGKYSGDEAQQRA